MTIAAIVVSFNRKDLLGRCLDALSIQSRLPDEIIVVDNGSTDGATELVKERFPTASLIETEKNIGGAGGFAWGLEIAIARGHDFAWIMDDDGSPQPRALAELLDVEAKAPGMFPFLASTVIVEDGTLNPGNVPAISRDPTRQHTAQPLGAYAVDAVTFVGVLINLEVAARTHLPILEYFIWFDDAEYTRRLSRIEPGLMVPTSLIVHPANKTSSDDLGERYFYFLRNNLWLLREGGYDRRYKAVTFLDLLAHSFKQGIHAKRKRAWLNNVVRGFGQGFFRKPSHQMPGDLIKTLPAEIAKIAARQGASARLALSSLPDPASTT